MVQNGTWLIYRGVMAKEDYFQGRTSEVSPWQVS
ncbi:MAG: hypothetical protein ACP5NY_00335 [Thermocladium sp.]